MARTQGHGNPKWTRDETILALDLYFRCKGKMPSSSDSDVIELSNVLQQLTTQSLETRRNSFRNPTGVAFKVQNLRNVATGKGLRNGSRMDREIWAEFGKRPEAVRELATTIRRGLEVGSHST